MKSRNIIAVLAIVALAGCASVPVKQKASETHQALRTALTSADDLERALCGMTPAAPNHCTTTAAATVGLTDAVHQDVSRRFAHAYEADQKVAAALIAWKAGDPAPADLAGLLADAQAALVAVKPLTGSGQQLTGKVQAWLDEVQSLVALFQKGTK
jgi:uncharacterized protein YceK